ncbi:MAG: hypothetical protein ACETWQ_03140 [Phycisphaerae bacterium]
MALPSKTIELMGQTADTIDNWPDENQKWNNKIIKDRPENLLSEISENLGYILEELQQHMPNMVELVQEKRKKLVRGVGRVYYPGMASYNSSRRCIISRDDATALAKTLHHIAEMAKENVSSERQKDGMIQPELPTRRVPLNKAAKWFGCDYRTLKKDIKSGKIKAKRFSDRRWEFDLNQVTEFNLSVRADADPTECSNTS